MADRLRFHELVPADLREAVAWYDGISERLGTQFREQVDSRFDEIEAQPERFAVSFDNVRLARVKRFPYLILFRMQGAFTQVLGVFHAASDPQKWRVRAQRS